MVSINRLFFARMIFGSLKVIIKTEERPFIKTTNRIMAKINKTMFRESDLRGRESSDELNCDSMELIGRAYGTFLKRRSVNKVVAGRDNRLSSRKFHKAAIKGLLDAGCKVIDIGLVTTPMLYWSQYYLKAKGGLMVTASHNPIGWNGVKLALGYSHTIIGLELQELYQIIISDDFSKKKGASIKKKNIFVPYSKDVIKRIKILKPLKVVVNAGNGAAGFFAPKVLRRAGCVVVEHLTGSDFICSKYNPNPVNVEMMKDTGLKVRGVGADMGIAFDGDGDRLGACDEKGEAIWPDRYLILLSRAILKKTPGAKIIFDVKCSQALAEDIKNFGGTPIMWKTGHSYIKEKLQKEKASLAGEMSGHIFFSDGYYGFDDAIFASLKLLEYI